MCFKLHLNVVSPPCLHNFGFELNFVKEEVGMSLVGLLRVHMLSSIRRSGVVGAQNLAWRPLVVKYLYKLRGGGYCIFICLHGLMVYIAVEGLIVYYYF